MELPQITQRIDTPELQNIKNQFALRERINSDLYETNQLLRKNPNVIFSQQSQTSLTDSVLRGLKYPLELDGRGGLKLSSNYDRIEQQILEVLDTRIGERVYRPYFGIPETIFETIDENVLAQTIKSKILSSIPQGVELEVKVYLTEYGDATVFVAYSVEGSDSGLVKYSFKP